MIKIENEIYYEDYEESLNLARNIDYSKYEYPELTLFHIYSEIKTEKELLCIKSWIATQNTKKCKLYLWSDYDISNNKLIQPYLDFLTLKIYNPIEESKGTLLEGKVDYLSANDDLHWSKSDLFRILITNKYGGIFSDMDVIYLRDFLPILDQEFVYQWGSETNFSNNGACATFLSTFKNSEFSNLLMSELIDSGIYLRSTIWGKDLIAKVYRKFKEFTIFPGAFFDTEWQINVKYKGLGDSIESGWFIKNEFSNILFEEAFAWHWHNSSNKNKIVEDGSKFYNLSKKTDEILNRIL